MLLHCFNLSALSVQSLDYDQLQSRVAAIINSTAPGARASRMGAENKLGDAGRKQAKSLLVLTSPLICQVMFGPVSGDFYESCLLTLKRHQQLDNEFRRMSSEWFFPWYGLSSLSHKFASYNPDGFERLPQLLTGIAQRTWDQTW
jgi:hypothetical protein